MACILKSAYNDQLRRFYCLQRKETMHTPLFDMERLVVTLSEDISDSLKQLTFKKTNIVNIATMLCASQLSHLLV
jgi:hypothetical protein